MMTTQSLKISYIEDIIIISKSFVSPRSHKTFIHCVIGLRGEGCEFEFVEIIIIICIAYDRVLEFNKIYCSHGVG